MPRVKDLPSVPAAGSGLVANSAIDQTGLVPSHSFVPTAQSDIAVTTADVTLTDAQHESLYLNLSGTLTGNRSILVKDDIKGAWFVNNATEGAFTVTVKPVSGTGVDIDQGGSAIVYSTGDEVVLIGLQTNIDPDGTLAANSDARVPTQKAVKTAITGRQSIPIPAGAMKARTTNGAASGTVEMTTNKNMFVTLDFDTSTQEFAQFIVPMPKSWNEGTVTFIPIWSHASTTTNFGVVWSLAGVAISNDDAGDVAFGTVQTSTDTGGTTNDIYMGPESSAITIAGTPAANDLVMFQIARVPSDGSDTMAIDARLHGIMLFITTDAGNDA